MAKLVVSALYVYPIKSLGGIKLEQALVAETGFLHDRKWVLIDGTGTFITQRKYPQLSLLQVSLSAGEITVSHKMNAEHRISFGINKQEGEEQSVRIWDDVTAGIEVDKKVSRWFSDYMEMDVKLLRMPERERRPVDPRYASDGKIVSYADGYPFLIIGQSSLDALNDKLEVPVAMDRFRPNIVFTGAEAHAEDAFGDFEICGIEFSAVKPCARCVLITIDQERGIKNAEPLKTLSKYRTLDKKVMFGQNLIHKGLGIIETGAEIKVSTTKIQRG